MSYVFDCFDEQSARLFSDRMHRLGRAATAYPSQEQLDRTHPYPFQLEGWVVVVGEAESDDADTNNVLADVAEQYHGEYYINV